MVIDFKFKKRKKAFDYRRSINLTILKLRSEHQKNLTKREGTNWKKLFATLLANKRLIGRIYKGVFNKETTSQ